MNRTHVALGVAALGVLAMVGWQLSASSVTVPEPTALAPLPTHTQDDDATRFVVGRTDAYRLLWTSEGELQAMPETDPLRVASHVDATLVITTVSVDETGVSQELALRDIQQFDVRMGDQSQALPLADIQGATARVERNEHGAVVDVMLSDDAPELAASTLRSIALSVLVDSDDNGERHTPYGVATDAWAGDVRTTHGYTTVDVGAYTDLSAAGEATVRWGAAGRLLALTAYETLTVHRDGSVLLHVTDSLQLAWAGAAPRRVAGTYTGSSGGVQRGLVARAESLSQAAVIRDVQAYDGSDAVDAQAIMWAGTAQVALDPAHAERISQIAREPGQAHKVRELSLDLLAHAPGGAGEAALLTALSDPEVRADGAWPAYLQRVGFVRDPSQAVVDFVHEQLASADPSTAAAAMAATGAVARQVHVSKGDPRQADAVVAPLRAQQPNDAMMHAAVLRGLGNGGQPDDRARLLASVAHDQPAVRAAAIHALRHYADTEVTGVMNSALTDDVAAVQRAALSRLTERGLNPEALGILRDAVTNDRIAGSNVQLTIGALAPHAASEAGRSALAGLIDHPQGDPRSRARIRALLTP